ncbi:MAG TPA: signal recognition particle-docking protein FtsY [Nannocystaceae bacterium]|nr:signal recognition particle-docking protein FtsY [Nannocystaceae bacterium]
MNDLVLGIIVAAIAIAVVLAWWLRSRRGLPPAPDAEPADLPPAERKTVQLSEGEREAALVVPTAERRTLELPTAESPAAAPPLAEGPPVERPRAPVFAPPPSASPLPVERPTTARPAVDDSASARRAERARVRAGLAKTRGGFVAKLARLLQGKPKVDADLKDRIEEVLFTADIGTSTAERLTKKVTELLDKAQVGDADSVWAVIEQAALEIVDIPAPPTDYAPAVRPYVLLAIGVNGVGKTTTLGKLAAQHLRAGRKVLLVAGDTFRAGAVDQLEVWARKVGAQIHMGDAKADPSSVIYDGILRGRKEGFDVVLCDTAGRLHTRKELMDELGKVRRAATKALAHDLRGARQSGDSPAGPHDTYLVLDATIGQNALAQAKLFKETTDFTGLVVTKLDGTAKGGVVLGVCDELRIPIRYVGIGEGVDDLRPFDAEDFVAALLSDRDRAGEDAA